MKWAIALLVVIVAFLQYRLWFGEGSIEQIAQLKRDIDKQKAENAGLQERNRALSAEIRELREGTDTIEAKARADMGMIKEGETFYFIPETPSLPLAASPLSPGKATVSGSRPASPDKTAAPERKAPAPAVAPPSQP